jgi:hypothetical protein
MNRRIDGRRTDHILSFDKTWIRGVRRCWWLAIVFGCSQNIYPYSFDRSIVVSGSCDPGIENGTAFDEATLDLGDATRLIVPAEAEIMPVPRDSPCRVVMEKRLHLMAHPPERVTIARERKEMGCAWARNGDEILIGTFGEYKLDGHGGADVKLIMHVPEGVEVITRKNLSGRECIANLAFILAEDGPGALGKHIDLTAIPNYAWTKVDGRPSRGLAAQARKLADEQRHARLADQ